jgi:hypothetical protein
MVLRIFYHSINLFEIIAFNLKNLKLSMISFSIKHFSIHDKKGYYYNKGRYGKLTG